MLSDYINEYIEEKRAIGFKFRIQASLLRNYARFAENHSDAFVCKKTVLKWSNLAPSPEQKRNRLLTVRRFAMAIHAEDKRHEIPPATVFGNRETKRKIRHLFSENDIHQLLIAASNLKPQGTIRPRTYSTLFALLTATATATGMRISEAISLNINDVTEDGLIIKSTKFKKDRLIPLHKSSQIAIQKYMEYRFQLGLVTAFITKNKNTILKWVHFQTRLNVERHSVKALSHIDLLNRNVDG